MPSHSPPPPGAGDDARRALIRSVVISRASTSPQRRREALREFLGVTRPDLGGEAAMALAGNVPPLPPELHEKWADMFAARLLETVPADQVALLCDGSPENAASLTLAYLMFLESERMEKQVAADIEANRREHPELAHKGREMVGKALRARSASMRQKAAGYAKAKTARRN
ncbi:MAG: hypothetical protein GYA47_15615 [Desulfovibrio sp.]|nr:hypothetical protein [Desulfovibrio sp.]